MTLLVKNIVFISEIQGIFQEIIGFSFYIVFEKKKGFSFENIFSQMDLVYSLRMLF